MAVLDFFVGERVLGPTTINLKNGRARLTCYVVEEWVRRKAWSIACGEKRRYVLKKRLGVSVSERSELESTLSSSLKLEGITELKSEVKGKLGVEFRVEESQEEEDEFSFQAPPCGRIDHTIYQLRRRYRFIYQDRRTWHQRLPLIWEDKSFDETIEEMVDAVYSLPLPTDPDPACKCKDQRSKRQGLVNLFFDKLGMLATFQLEGERLTIPSLNFSVQASRIEDIYYKDFSFDREAMPEYLLFLVDEKSNNLTGQFRPVINVGDSAIRRERKSDTAANLTSFILGASVGAVVALLFAPKSGRELRGDIADAAHQGADAARERAGEYYEQARGRATEFYSTAAERAGEFAQTARQAAARRTETLSAGIEAGHRVSIAPEAETTHDLTNESS